MKRPKRFSPEQLEILCTGWNRAYPVGTAVKVRRDDGSITETKTSGEAWVMGGHSAMIMVEGISGGYALERVTAT